jgi:hypothetical protein
MAELSAQAPLPRARGFGRGGRSGRAGKPSRRAPRGEAQQATEAGLDLLRVLGWLVLHDVGLPEDLHVDHLLAGPSGVYVIDTVAWSGPIKATDHGLVVGALDRADALEQLAAAAEAVRGVLHGTPVAPMLCFERLEPVAGVAGAVALCATENILELLTSQPEILDRTAVAKASGMLGLACRPDATAHVVVPQSTRRSATPMGDQAEQSVTLAPAEPEDAPAAAVASAEDIARGAAFERLLEGTAGTTTEPEPRADPGLGQEDGYAAIHDAGAALWRELTDDSDTDEMVQAGPAPVDVEAAVLEAELWERQVAEAASRAEQAEEAEEDGRSEQARATAEAHEREAADREAQEARNRKAREAFARVEQEAQRLAPLEAEELAQREANQRAEVEARERAEVEAREQAEAEALESAEAEAREQAEAEVRERAEAEVRERAEAEVRERAEAEARERAEAEAFEWAEARVQLEAESRRQAEVVVREQVDPGGLEPEPQPEPISYDDEVQVGRGVDRGQLVGREQRRRFVVRHEHDRGPAAPAPAGAIHSREAAWAVTGSRSRA